MSQSRKQDHIELSFDSVPDHKLNMLNSSYEPLLSAHPDNPDILKKKFLGCDFGMPLWVSSMTGGTEKAHQINHNLAKACGQFKLGMGLGSCRALLESNERFDDFDVKKHMGNAPLFTNFGIAQCEELIEASQLEKISELIKRLQADGLVIHVNPLQEWAQPEGDRFKHAPLETIQKICDDIDVPIIVKEVGQGMGSKSLKALLELPIAAIELAGYGGTNFSMLEQARSEKEGDLSPDESLSFIGHTPLEMIEYLNALLANGSSQKDIIISGGIKDVVTGHILMQHLNMNSIIGMASSLLKHAMGDYEALERYLIDIRDSLMMANTYIISDNNNK